MKYFCALFAIILSIGCTGGTQSNGTAQDAKPTPAGPIDGPLKVALLTPSSISDSGWSALAYRGLQAIAAETGAEIKNAVAAQAQEAKDLMRSYGQQGFHLVIGHGYEYNQHGIDIGKDFPKTIFLSTSGSQIAPNVGCLRFYLEQAMYVLGAVAAKMSKNGTVAMIGGPEVPSIASTFDAFEQGAKETNRNIRVLRTFTGSNDDVGKAKAQTLAAIDQGADFVIHQANAAAQGVFEACRERGIMAFGTNSDQSAAAPDVVLASAVIVAEPVFVRVAKSIQEGSYQSGIELVGMKDDAIAYVWNPQLLPQVPDDVVEMARTLAQKIREGEIKVTKREF